MTRAHVIETVNRHRQRRNRPPIFGFARAVAYARQHRLISEEYLTWARLGYFPDPPEEPPHP